MLRYSTIQHRFTNVKQLFKQRNIMHTAAPSTNNVINATRDKEYTYYVTLSYVGVINVGKKRD